MLSFFPRDVLDEILNLIESVSEGVPTYSWKKEQLTTWYILNNFICPAHLLITISR